MTAPFAFADLQLGFSPMMDWEILWLILGLGLAPVIFALSRGARGWPARALIWLILALYLLNPRQFTTSYEDVAQTILVAVDQSASARLGQRTERTNQSLAVLMEKLDQSSPPFAIKTVPIKGGANGTHIWAELEPALATIPPDQLAGIIVLTDGASGNLSLTPDTLAPAPFNVILTGSPDEVDRRIEIIEAPRYTIMGEDVLLKLRIHDTSADPSTLRVRVNGGDDQFREIFPGEVQEILVKIPKSGANLVQLDVPLRPGELTDLNNNAHLTIQGIRDQLRVLLVSNAPHMGLRMWRNLLKSDPSVELVHFTLLRGEHNFDPTPSSQLSLIPFPVQELFIDTIDSFDLLILDRLAENMVLRPGHYQEMAAYVARGGGLLVVTDGTLPPMGSLWDTALADILPVTLAGEATNTAFIPKISDQGENHPITRDLSKEPMAPWAEMITTRPHTGHTLMMGPEGLPLLQIARHEQGRVAVLTSPDLWRWARNLQGGGPWEALSRRLSHWLMQEPELEEEALSASISGQILTISRQTLTDDPHEIRITDPLGQTNIHLLPATQDGRQSLSLTIEQPGIWSIDDGQNQLQLAHGAGEMKEFLAPLGGPEALRNLVEKSKGGMVWAGQDYRLASKSPGSRAALASLSPPSGPKPDVMADLAKKRGELRLEPKAAGLTTGLTEHPLAPGWLYLLLALAALGWAWWRESR